MSQIQSSPFAELGLCGALVRALADEGYSTPTPIQARVTSDVLGGRDVVACAQTGTGKTAAFVLPLLEQLRGARERSHVRALVLTPTRELAAQIGERIAAYGRYLDLRHCVVFGGVSQHRQELALRAGADIVVATPGRLLDLMQQGVVDLAWVRHLVLDEADRMLDMGFIRDVRAICARVPTERQTLLFSATMPPAVVRLANTMLVGSPGTELEFAL